MASQRNQFFSTSSFPLPKNFGYRVRDPVCLCAIEGLRYPIKMNLAGLGCDINDTLTTLLLLLLLELAGLAGLELTKLIEGFIIEITRVMDGAR